MAAQSAVENPVPGLAAFLSEPANSLCCDCGAPAPSWASVNTGAVVCLACSGVHRNMGVHISMMQSVILDKWSDDQCALFISLGGNAAVNAKLEHTIPEGFEKIEPDAERAEREEFIRNKYDRKLFVEGSNTAPRTVEAKNEALSARRASTSHSAAAAVAMIEFGGMIMIKLVSGSNLVAMDIGGKSDPYVIMKVGKQQVKSKIVKNSLNPTWNENLMLCVEKFGQHLEIQVYDWDRTGSDDFMGEASVEITREMECATGIAMEVPLQNTKKGSLNLVIQYVAIGH